MILETQEYIIVKNLKGTFINVPQVGKRSKIIDIENALKLANADGVVTYEEIRQNLKKWEFPQASIFDP